MGLGAFAPAHPGSGSGAPRSPHGAGQPARVQGSPVCRVHPLRFPRAGQCTGWPMIPAGVSGMPTRHAVYLGQPGVNQECPAHLVGRTATISIQAASPTPGPASGVADPVGTGAAVGTLPQVGGSVTRDAQDQELGASLADPGRIGATGTYTGGGRRGAGHPAQPAAGGRPPTRAGAAPGPARVDEGPGGGPALRALSALSPGTVRFARAGATLHAGRATRPGHPHPHKGRQHRRARKHRAASTRGASTRGASTRPVSVTPVSTRPPHAPRAGRRATAQAQRPQTGPQAPGP